MIGQGIFNGGQSNDAMDQIRRQLEFQQNQYGKMQNAITQQNGATSLLEEFKRCLSELTQDEQNYLTQVPEFIQSKQIYEAGFIDFLGGKFAAEYLNTPVGRQAIENLTETTKRAVKNIKDSARERNIKLEALASLAAEDPEIQKKLQEKLKHTNI